MPRAMTQVPIVTSLLFSALSAFAPGVAPAADGAGARSGPVGAAASARSGLVAPGSPWETPYWIVSGRRPGPTVLVVGGVHGNEPAGVRAAEQIRDWRVRRGRLIVVPRANRPGFEKGVRALPDLGGGQAADLNRLFPAEGAPEDLPEDEPARSIWMLVREWRPDWIVDLHEGFDFTRKNRRSVGSSVITSEADGAADAARRVLETINATIDDPDKTFVLKSPPISGSLARAAAERLEVAALILETTSSAQPLSLRVRQHRLGVHRLLSDLEMAQGGPEVMTPPASEANVARLEVALWDAGGASRRGVAAVERVLDGDCGFLVRRIGPGSIRAGALSQFSVVVFPAGSGARQAGGLGEDGARAVREFVRGGGGFVGLGAGLYLASVGYPWSLGLIDGEVVDRAHWRRGTGRVAIEWTEQGRALLGEGAAACESLHYRNGPLVAPAGDDARPDLEPLAVFRGEVRAPEPSSVPMTGHPALLTASYGRGRVLGASGHPESTPGMEDLLRRAVRWAGHAGHD